MPSRAGGGERRRSVRQAHGAARDLPRDARAGGDPGRRRSAHGAPGLDADAAARRPGAACVSRTRGLAGARLRQDLRGHRKGGMGGRERRADPGARRARIRDRARGPPGAGRARIARGRSLRRGRRRGRGAGRDRGGAAARRGPGTAARAARGGGAATRRRRRGRLDGFDERGCARVLRGERATGRVRVPLPGLRRQRLAELCRRAGRGDGRPPRRAARGRRPRARDRGPAGRGADSALHAARGAGPAPDV